MSIQSLTLLLSAALVFTAVGCDPESTDDRDVVVTDGVNDDVGMQPLDATTNPKAVDNNDDLDVVVEKDLD